MPASQGLIVIGVPAPILIARNTAILRQVPACMKLTPSHAVSINGKEAVALLDFFNTAADALESAVTPGTPADPAAEAGWYVQAEVEDEALEEGITLYLRRNNDWPSQWASQARLLRLIEAEQAPVVAPMRAEAEAKGKEYKYWSVVSYEEWVKARD